MPQPDTCDCRQPDRATDETHHALEIVVDNGDWCTRCQRPIAKEADPDEKGHQNAELFHDHIYRRPRPRRIED